VVGKNAAGTDRIAPSGAPIWGTPVIDLKRAAGPKAANLRIIRHYIVEV